ncbi:MAG: sialidase family protein, partial [Planctomycetaceae bacterium]
MVYRSFLTLLLVIQPANRALAEPLLSRVDVLISGEEGYHTFRIPCLLTAGDGSLLAFAEARKHNASDPGFDNNDIDLVMKRSTDDGRTWSRLRVIDDPGEYWSACNPVAVLDRTTGGVCLVHARTKPGRNSYTARPGTDDAQNWVRFSDDHGVTWSAPKNITRIARDIDGWGGTFCGPGGGIQDR